MNNNDLIKKNRQKLEELIQDNASGEEILKQSQILDVYIVEDMKQRIVNK